MKKKAKKKSEDLEFLTDVKTNQELEEQEELESLTSGDVLNLKRSGARFKKITIGLGVALGLSVILNGFQFFSGGEEAPPVTTEIVGMHPLLERVESIKDGQIKALEEKIKINGEVLDKSKSLSQTTMDDLLVTQQGIQSAHTNLINKFYNDFVSIDPLSSDSKLETLRNEISASYLTEEAKNQRIYDIFKGNSIRKELGTPIRLVGSSTNAILAQNNQESLYLTLLPVTSEEEQHVALYLTNIEANRINDSVYLGKVDASVPVQSIYDTATQKLKEMNFNFTPVDETIEVEKELEGIISEVQSPDADGNYMIKFTSNANPYDFKVTKDVAVSGQIEVGKNAKVVTLDGNLKSISIIGEEATPQQTQETDKQQAETQ